MSIVMTQPAEQLTRDTDLIVIVSAAANVGQHTASTRHLPTAQSRMNTSLIIVTVVGTVNVDQFIATAKVMITGVRRGMADERESPSTNATVTSTSIPLDDGRDTMTPKRLKRTIDITATLTVIHQIKNRRVADLIVAGSTERKLSLRRAVREVASALPQTGCAGDRNIPTAIGLTSSRQGRHTHEAEMCIRESTSQATVLIVPLALRTATGLMRNLKRRISVMCAED